MRYQQNDGTMRDDYPHAFGPDDFRKLEDFLATRDRVTPLIEVARGDRSANAISMRHDVDHNLEHAVKFARWETARGFRSSYFLLHSAWYWNEPEMMKRGVDELLALGHEVGIHNNAVALARDLGPDPGWERARIILEVAILTLTELGASVRGAAAHGDRRCDTHQVHNNDMWVNENPAGGGYQLADFGLEYEAYFLHRDAWYISDSGGTLVPPAPLEHDDEILPKRTTMLIHPCHWDIDTELGEPLWPGAGADERDYSPETP